MYKNLYTYCYFLFINLLKPYYFQISLPPLPYQQIYFSTFSTFFKKSLAISLSLSYNTEKYFKFI